MVSSSTDCEEVLDAACLSRFFAARVDGIVAEREGLRGTPAPDTFLAGARALGVAPAERPSRHLPNSFYETWPLPYPEGGYGYPEAGPTVVNVTNGKLIRLLVDDEPRRRAARRPLRRSPPARAVPESP